MATRLDKRNPDASEWQVMDAATVAFKYKNDEAMIHALANLGNRLTQFNRDPDEGYIPIKNIRSDRIN